MTGGLFRGMGYFQGERLHAPSDENPLGYFEDALVNRLNNSILARHVPKPVDHQGITYGLDSPGPSNGWLSRISPKAAISALPSEAEELERLVERRPFCLKDPRFSYTLHLWKEKADGICICVFRNPATVVESILRCCRTRPALFGLSISVQQAFEVWALMHQHILEHHMGTGRWLFCSYESLINGGGLDRIESFVDHAVDRDFPRKSLDRTHSRLELPAQVGEIYSTLLELAEH